MSAQAKSAKSVRQAVYKRRCAMRYRDRLADYELRRVPIREQARLIGLSYSTVCSYRTALGIGIRGGREVSRHYWENPETRGGRLAAALPREEAARLLREGVPRAQMARDFGVDYSMMRRLLAHYGMPAHARKLSAVTEEERRRRMADMVERGLTSREIAAEFGASRSWVGKWKTRFGLADPSRGCKAKS